MRAPLTLTRTHMHMQVHDLEAALREAGFEAVVTQETDPRHRTVLALKPRA